MTKHNIKVVKLLTLERLRGGTNGVDQETVLGCILEENKTSK